MAGKSITAMAWLRRTVRNALTGFRRRWLNTVWGMQIGEGCAISWSARLDRTNPRGIVIGRDTAVVFGAAILAHDTTRRLHRTTRIGERCNIGAHALVMPGVTIGDGSIVAAGAVVVRDIPPGCIAWGNPARVLEKGIVTGKWGIIQSRASQEEGGTAPAGGADRAATATETGRAATATETGRAATATETGRAATAAETGRGAVPAGQTP